MKVFNFAQVRDDPHVNCYFPDYEEGKLPNRDYFFKVRFFTQRS